MSRRIDVGYVPLLDAAPLIIAAEMGFAAEEGLELALHRELSWAALRDRLIWGGYHAAHMLAPVVVAQTAGIGVGDAAIDALMVLSVNGNMIGAEPGLAAAIAATGVRLPRRRRHGPGARRRRWGAAAAPRRAVSALDACGARRLLAGAKRALRRRRSRDGAAAADGIGDGRAARSTPSASASPGAASRSRWAPRS